MEKVLMVLLLLALAGCTDYVPEPVPYKTGDRHDNDTITIEVDMVMMEYDFDIKI